MNQAYVDGSFDEDQQLGGRGGYGVVLLCPQQAAAHLHGLLEQVHDCNVTELRAVLAAVAHAPAGEALSVHTDNTNVLTALRGRAQHEGQAQEARRIHDLAAQRGIALQFTRAERVQRHMQRAHLLANAARLATPLPVSGPYAESHLRIEAWRQDIEITLRRASERVSAPLSPSGSGLPRSVQALLLALSLTKPEETLITYQASKLAAALWQNPKRALPGPAQDELRAARDWADARGVTVLFERVE